MSDDPDGDQVDVVGVGGEAEKKREGCFLRSSRSLCGDGKLDMHRRRVLSHCVIRGSM